MADASAKVPENVEGPYFVDESCTACETCIEEAPGNFKMKNNGEYAFAYKQPENDDEEIQCENALNICPVGAIGKEG